MSRVDVDVEERVEIAWRAFEHRLTADLVELQAGQAVRVEVPTGRGGWSPVALLLSRRPRTILVRANGAPPLGGAGSAPRRRQPAGVPATKQFRVGTESVLAAWVVDVLRQAYAVIHPAFLRQTRRGAAELDGRAASTRSADRRAGSRTEPAALPVPASAEELEELVEQALAAVTGGALVRDQDGDIPLVGDHGTAYVRVRRDQPVVEVFAALTQVEPSASGDIVRRANAHNARSSLITYVLMHDWLVARISVWCQPFVAPTVLHAVDQVMAQLEPRVRRAGRRGGAAAVTDVAEAGAAVDPRAVAVDDGGDADRGDDESISGEVLAEPSTTSDGGGTDDRLAPELLTVIQLDAAEPGSVSPELAARIFGYDRDRLLAGIRTSEEQSLEWRRSIEDARQRDEEEAAVCEGESTSWQETADLLRAALRVAVER